MRTEVLGPMAAEMEALVERRRALGLDRYDGVWEGEYHMAPASHPRRGDLDQEIAVALHPLARADDYRVPDRGVHRSLPDTVFVPTAAVVVDIVSPEA